MRSAILAAVAVCVGLVVTNPAQAAGPRAPGLQAPASGASVESLPTFSWRAAKGAYQYEFQVSADAKFGSIVLGKGRGRGQQSTRNTSATLDKTIPDGKYYWRVRAVTKSGRAGAWAKSRTFTKVWKATPTLLEPSDETAVSWPSAPLVLRWSSVPRATHYLVTIATDPSLAQNVIGTANKPVETQGTVYALQGTLPAGRYYWAITPVDAGNQRGARSSVGSFTWSWPTATATRLVDLNDTAAVIDPLLDWDGISGAARYEVEINPDNDFSPGSRVCCKERVLGTSLSPLRLLPDNTYHWRVRAFDADDNPGQWNVGTPFVKTYNNVAPTVPNVAVETVTTVDAAAASPLVTWGAVPGAAQYQVQWTEHTGGVCGWSNASGPIKTSALAWAPLAPSPSPTGIPGGIGITTNMRPNGTTGRFGQPFGAERAYSSPVVTPFLSGRTYCVRVRALSDDSYRENDGATSQVISQWTQFGGSENSPAFTYGAPPSAASDPAPSQLPPPVYLSPVGGGVERTPVLRWGAVGGARRYFVLIARDPNFTNVIDAAFTATTVYVPNLALEDEETSYYWVVIPASRSNGSGISGGPTSYNPQSFRKLSVPPNIIEPGVGADLSTQPRFRWGSAEGAQKYRIQVSADPQFGELLDDVVTAATAYTSQTPYPADTALYWRVRGEQQQTLQGASERVELRWSPTGTFRRRLPVPTPSADNPTLGFLIPAFTWSPVPGAISYDLHVDEADGDTGDFTIKSAAFTPTKFTGTGVFRYKVRANFATRSGKVASAYFPSQPFTRVINPPGAPRMTRTKTRLVFSWLPTASAANYRVEVSTTDSFTRLVDSIRTENLSWAPDLSKRDFRTTGPLYWRVAAVDAGNNVGAFASKTISRGKAMRVTARGSLRRGATGRVTVVVRGSTGKALAAAAVRVSGAGVRAQTRRTNKRGSVSFSLRPTKAGTVTFSVSRSGYGGKSVRKRVK